MPQSRELDLQNLQIEGLWLASLMGNLAMVVDVMVHRNPLSFGAFGKNPTIGAPGD